MLPAVTVAEVTRTAHLCGTRHALEFRGSVPIETPDLLPADVVLAAQVALSRSRPAERPWPQCTRCGGGRPFFPSECQGPWSRVWAAHFRMPRILGLTAAHQESM